MLRKIFPGGSYKVYFLKVGLISFFPGEGPKNGLGIINRLLLVGLQSGGGGGLA